MNPNTFDSLGISEKFLRALKEVGYTQPTPVQSQSIPHLIEGKDLLGIAQTGTGKTAAFALPVLQRLNDENTGAKSKQPRALILAPTRELALQIHGEFSLLGRHTNLRHATIIGGVGPTPQIKAAARGLDVLIATPGRLLDLTNAGHIDLSKVSVLVLDEADRLLDMGFIPDIKRIVAKLPTSRQSMLFSATMPKEIVRLANDILKNPIRVDVSPKEVTVKETVQRVINVNNSDKQRMLEHLLRSKEVSRAIVFTRTKHGANKVARQLTTAGIDAETIHGNKSQSARQRALKSFKDGESWVLVATDIAARGIDISGVSHVFNYELPHEPESYVHRIGRTGRAGAAGAAWSLVDPSERGRLRAVEKLIRFSPSEMAVELPARDNTQPKSRPVSPKRPPSGKPPANRSYTHRSQAQGRPQRRRRQGVL